MQGFYAGRFEAVRLWSGCQTAGKSPGLWSVLPVRLMSGTSATAGKKIILCCLLVRPLGILAGNFFAHLMWAGTQTETAPAFVAVIGTIQRITSALPTATTPLT